MKKHARFDFHLHTHWSYDASASVKEYFQLARELSLKAIAITEHHNMDSLAEIRQIAQAYPDIAYIVSAELTVHSQFGSIDMVCMNLPLQPTGALHDVLMKYRSWQQEYGSKLSAAVTAAGFDYSDEVRAELLRRYRPEKTIAVQGLTHVQGPLQDDFLVKEKKYFASVNDFHELIWASDLPNYPEASEVIPAVKAAGGVVFIAHPAGYFRKNDLKRMDEMREVLMFDGIECAHTSIPEELTPFYREYCLKHGLLSTAGSDTHSVPGNQYRFCEHCNFACHIGDSRWKDEIFERVKVYNK